MINSFTTIKPSAILISFSTIVAAFVVAYIAYRASLTSQKNNARTILAKYRSKWQHDARKAISAYIYNASLIVLRTLDNNEFIASDDFNKLYAKMSKNQILFMSMLDPSKSYHKRFDDAFQDLYEVFFAGKHRNPQELGKNLEELHMAACILLEKAWNDIKVDSFIEHKKTINLNDKLKLIADKFSIQIDN